MLYAIFGESCTGKSTIAEALRAQLSATVYTGKDYLRLEKSEDAALRRFRALLAQAVDGDEHIVYVISERAHLALLPEGCRRVLVTAELDVIRARFAQRMHGQLPPPVAAMLERQHGCFDQEPHDLHVRSGELDIDEVCRQILAL